ncbi:MAG: CoA-binding protein [Elusimicrobiota bacterium]|jgi:predicted CoA-binding protein|nr:CoA-binding protein [Elusimicrobiota bacterium]
MENIKIAVAASSTDTSKYWYRIYRDIFNYGLEVYCINPKVEEADGKKTYPDIKSLPQKVDTLVLVVRPELTGDLVKDAIATGITDIYFQPGAYDSQAAKLAQDAGVSVHDYCFMVSNGIW